MSAEISISVARAKLLEMLLKVEQGERFTITKRGRPMASLVPAEKPPQSKAQAVRLMRAFGRVAGVRHEDMDAWIATGRR